MRAGAGQRLHRRGDGRQGSVGAGAGLAARQSTVDRTLEGVLGPEARDFFPLPTYRDAIAKAELDLRQGETLSVVALGASDRLRRQIPSEDPALTRSEDQGVDFARLYVRYQRLTPAGASLSVVPFVGLDRSERATAFAAGSPQRSGDPRTNRRSSRRSQAVMASRRRRGTAAPPRR